MVCAGTWAQFTGNYSFLDYAGACSMDDGGPLLVETSADEEKDLQNYRKNSFHE